MQRGTVVSLKQLKVAKGYLKNNWCLITLTAAFLIGIVFGATQVHNKNQFFNLIREFSDEFMNIRITGDFLKIFTNSVILNFTFLLLMFVIGTSVIGITIAPIFLFLRGLIFGALASLIYSEYALKGIAFNALILIPPSVIAVIFLIISAKGAMGFSLHIIKITLPDATPKNLNLFFNRYWKNNLILVIPMILSSLLDAWLSVKLVTFFNL